MPRRRAKCEARKARTSWAGLPRPPWVSKPRGLNFALIVEQRSTYQRVFWSSIPTVAPPRCLVEAGSARVV